MSLRVEFGRVSVFERGHFSVCTGEVARGLTAAIGFRILCDTDDV